MDRRGSPLRPQGVVRLAALTLAVGLALAGVAAEAQTVSRVKLVVVKTGPLAALGSVESGGGAPISCGSRCAARFSRGNVVSLYAYGSSFVGWSGACVGSSPRCVLAMDANRRVRATFGVSPPSVRVTVARGGTITSDPPGLLCGSAGGVCRARFDAGSTVALSPKPDPGYEFAGWSGSCSDTVAIPCTLRVPDSVAAAFRRTGGPTGDARLTVVPRGPGYWLIRSSPPGIACTPVCTVSFAPGTVVTLESRSVYEWNGACIGTAPRCHIVVDEPLEVHAWADTRGGGGTGPPQFGVSVSVSGRGTVTGGQVIRCGEQARSIRDCGAFFQSGQVVALRAVPARGARFAGWAGFCNGRGRCTLRVVGAMHVIGLFRG
jgi:Divergent InlB B-repeat domain